MKVIKLIIPVIIAFAAISIIAGRLGQKAALNAHKSNALQAISQLYTAFDDYFEAYQQLPLGSESNTDKIQLTTGNESNTIMTNLCSLVAASNESYKTENLFVFRKDNNGKDGLARNEEGTYAELFDPWGNPYHVLLDYDYDEKLKDPFTGEIIPEKKALIWSLGPDGQSGTPDDIQSWQ